MEDLMKALNETECENCQTRSIEKYPSVKFIHDLLKSSVFETHIKLYDIYQFDIPDKFIVNKTLAGDDYDPPTETTACSLNMGHIKTFLENYNKGKEKKVMFSYYSTTVESVENIDEDDDESSITNYVAHIGTLWYVSSFFITNFTYFIILTLL